MTLHPLILLCLTVPIAAMAQEKAAAGHARVFVTDSESWQLSSQSGGGYSGFADGFGSHGGGGARPQTAEIVKTIGERCPNLVVNNRLEMGDYVLRLEHEGGKGLLSHKNKVAVFVRSSGDSIFSASTLSLGGSVQQACAAIEKHWDANAAAFSLAAQASPAPPVAASAVLPPPEMASLTVESSVPGADIEVDGEFMGSAPSTLSLVPGKHTVIVRKKGYAEWSRVITVSGSAVHLSAELKSAS